MTTYKRSERRHCRYWLRQVAWRVNLLLAVLALALVVWLAQAGAVRAAPRCPNGGTATPHGCSYEPTGMTCGWPLLINGERVMYCVRYAPAVQP